MSHDESIYKVSGKQQPAGYSFETADYDQVQLIYVTVGRLLFYGHGMEGPTALNPNMLVLLMSGDRFRLSCDDGQGYRGFCVIVEGVSGGLLSGHSIVVLADRSIRLLSEMIQRHMSAAVPESREILEGLGKALVWEAQSLSKERRCWQSREWAEAVRTVLEVNVSSGMSVRDALATLPMSQRQLCRHFREHYDTSPKSYQNLLRIDESRRMLTETDMEITSIAIELGFYSSQHFASQFRALVGMSPSEYRKRY